MITPEIVAAIVGLLGGVISIASAFTAARMYVAKRNVDKQIENQRQQHERDVERQRYQHEKDMAELSARQDLAEQKAQLAASSGESVRQLALSIHEMSETFAETNRQAAADRQAAREQAADFNQTVAANAMAKAALAEAVSTNTATTNTSASAVGELSTKVDNLRAAIETTLQRMEGGAQEWREVKGVLVRVVDYLNTQTHDAASTAQVAMLTEAARRRTGEVTKVDAPPEKHEAENNGSSD